MKLDFILLLILIIHYKAILSERVSIIGSQYIPEDSNYKILLLTNNLSDDSFINVSLLIDGHELTHHLRNFKEDSYSEVHFKVPQKTTNNCKLKVTAFEKDKCTQQTIKLIKPHENPIIFIQLDKPIYKTGDDFKFRIFVLNKSMIPLTSHRQIDVTVRDSKDNVVLKLDNIKAENGVIEGFLKISEAPNLGRWKIVTNVMGRVIAKHFNVEKSVDEGLEVQLEIPSVVSFQDRRMYGSLIVSDKFNKFFIGTANVSASAKFKGSDKIVLSHHVKDLDIFGNKKGISIDFADELGIRFPTADMLLKFDVTLTDAATKRSTKISKEIEMKYKVKNAIEVVRKKYFKPGFKFSTKVRVKLLNGRFDNGFNQLAITNVYHNRNKKTNQIQKLTKSFKVNLKNGEASNILQTKPETKKIEVKLGFAGAELEEELWPLPTFGAKEYMQIAFANRSTKIGDTVLISATTTGEMENLHVLVFGQDGIIHDQEFPDAVGLDIYKFPIKLTNNMRPEVRVLAFYVKPESGVIIYDELLLSLGFSVPNSIDIFADEALAPNKQATIKFKTEKGSKVYLSASDVNPLSLVRDNEISRNDIYNEVVYYLNLKYPNASDYHFEKLNAFILNPLQSPVACGDESANVLSYGSSVNDEFSRNSNDVKYFPDVWFDESYDVTSDDVQAISLKAPEALTTYRYFGISIHPQKGLTVAKTLPKTAVKSEISIQLKAPAFAYNGEILWIDVAVFNSLVETLNADVSIKVINGYFVENKSRVEYSIKCLDFQQTKLRSQQFSLDIGSEKLSATETLLIQPDGKGDVTITVNTIAGTYNDEVTKVIKLINFDKHADEETISEGVRIESEVDPSWSQIVASAVDGIEHLFSNPLTSDDERILKFSTAITSYKYQKLVKGDSQNSINNLLTGYQEALSVVDKLSQATDHNSIMLAAMTAETLVEALQFIDIDRTVITKAFEFLQAQQRSDGSFKYNSSHDCRAEMGKNREAIQTTQIVSIFSKNENRREFTGTIKKSLDYLKEISMTDDYQRALTAYALALNKDKNNARELLKEIKNKPWNDPQTALDIEVMAYKILTEVLLDQDPQADVKWLIKQVTKPDAVYSPYSGDLILRALFEYAKHKHPQPDEGSNGIKVFEHGRDNTKPSNTSDYFLISANRVEVSHEEFKIEVTVDVKDQNVNNLIIFELELPRGFRYLSHDSSESIQGFDALRNGNQVRIRINKLRMNQNLKISINALKIFEFSNHQFSMIKVYDYYRPSIKDTFHYDYDKNEESCERIRVEREIEKAQKILNDAQLAQNITSEAKLINGAENLIKHAQKLAMQARTKVENANATIAETNVILSNALQLAIESYKEAVKAEGRTHPVASEISVMQVRSSDALKRTRRDLSEAESEAIKAEKIAQQAKLAANTTRKEWVFAEEELKISNSNLDKANEDVENARLNVSMTLADVQAAQTEAVTMQKTILDAQVVVNRTEIELYEVNARVSTAGDKVELTSRNIEKVKLDLKRTQRKVNAAVALANNALEKATKALKGIDVQVEVDKAAVNVKDILAEARDILKVASSAKQQAIEDFNSINIVNRNTSAWVRAECESARTKAKSIQQDAIKLLDKSQEKCKKYQEALDTEVRMTKAADEAQIKVDDAENKALSTKNSYDSANKAAKEAQEEADKARKLEADEAGENAKLAAGQMSAIELTVVEASNLTEAAEKVWNETASIIKEADRIEESIVTTNKEWKADEESDKMQKLSSLIEEARNWTKEAKSVLVQAKRNHRNAKHAAENAEKSTNAQSTTNESAIAKEALNNLKDLATNATSIMSEIQKVHDTLIRSRLLAQVSKDTALLAKQASAVNKTLNEVTESSSLIAEDVKKLNDQLDGLKITQNLQHFEDFIGRLKAEVPRHKNEASESSRSVLSLAEKARKSSDYNEAEEARFEAEKLLKSLESLKVESEQLNKKAHEVQGIVNQATEAVKLAIDAKKNSALTFEIAKSVEDIQSSIDSLTDLLLSNLLQVAGKLSQDSQMKSLLDHLITTLEASKNDKKLASLAKEASEKSDFAVNKALDAVKNVIKVESLQTATSLANQAESSLNDTIASKNDATKLKGIAELSLKASMAVTKAANAFIKSFKEVKSTIIEDNEVTAIQASAKTTYQQLHTKTVAKEVIDKIAELVLTAKAAKEQTYEAALKILNELTVAENHKKSIESSHQDEDLNIPQNLLNSVEDAANKAEQELKLVLKSSNDLQDAKLKIQEAAEEIQKIAESEEFQKTKVGKLRPERISTEESLTEQHEEGQKIVLNTESTSSSPQTKVDREQTSSRKVQEAANKPLEVEFTSVSKHNQDGSHDDVTQTDAIPKITQQDDETDSNGVDN